MGLLKRLRQAWKKPPKKYPIWTAKIQPAAPPKVSDRPNPEPRPNPLFNDFRQELSVRAPVANYDWHKGKESSCGWIIRRIPPGTTGVDIGGTEYLCHRLAKKGCDVTYYDFVPPSGGFDKFIVDDMFNASQHFPEQSLDFITTRHTLEHSIVPLFQLWTYNRLLKDHGRLFVIVPMYMPAWVWFHTHFSCLPYDSWIMLFYRAGFDVVASESGTWAPQRALISQEHRFELRVATREMRLENRKPLF